MANLRGVFELFEIDPAKITLLEKYGLTDFELLGKTPGLFSKKYVIRKGNKHYITKDGLAERISGSIQLLEEVAGKLDGKIFIDLEDKKVIASKPESVVIYTPDGVKALFKDTAIGKLVSVLHSLDDKVNSENHRAVTHIIEELNKGYAELSNVVRGWDVYVDTGEGKILLLFPGGLGIEILPNDTADWETLTAKIIATLRKEKVIDDVALGRIKSENIRKMVRGML